MIQLLLHLFGDYFTQNDWMATNKGTFSVLGWFTCILHCLLYSIAFGLYYHNLSIFLLVFGTHFLIDKFSLARYVTKLVNWNWERDWGGDHYSHDLGFDENRPAYITIWIHIIRDNSLHVACNYFIIQHFTNL